MKCNHCNRRVKDSVQGRINHMVKYHQDKILGMGMRIAANPYGFGQALGEYVKENAPQLLKGLVK